MSNRDLGLSTSPPPARLFEALPDEAHYPQIFGFDLIGGP
jgi:hypothetical protein